MNLAKLRERGGERRRVVYLFIYKNLFCHVLVLYGQRNDTSGKTAKQVLGPSLLSFLFHLSNSQQCLNDCFPGTSEVHSPASLVSPGEPLDGDGGVALAQILLARQPASDGFLDADAGDAQLVRSQLLQVGNLACPEEDFGLAKLIFILVLRERKEQRLEISIIH